jgi:hypothetical protein
MTPTTMLSGFQGLWESSESLSSGTVPFMGQGCGSTKEPAGAYGWPMVRREAAALIAQGNPPGVPTGKIGDFAVSVPHYDFNASK